MGASATVDTLSTDKLVGAMIKRYGKKRKHKIPNCAGKK